MSQVACQRFPVCLEGFNNTGGTLSAFLAVKGGPSSILLPTALTDACYGFLTEDAADQSMGNVQIGGVAICTAGTGGITEGDRLVVEANTGKMITWAPAGGANQSIVGTCLKTAAANKLGEILIGAGGIGQGA